MTTGTPDAHDPHAAPDSNAADAAHGSDAAHDSNAADALGPIDIYAWGAGALGVALGLVVAACFVLATATISG